MRSLCATLRQAVHVVAVPIAISLGLAACTAAPPPPEPVIAPPIQPSLASLPPEPGSDPAQAGCFQGQMSLATWGSRVAEATVHTHTPSDLGDLSGSGFVVRDSGPNGLRQNLILTAGHVADSIIVGGGLIAVSNAKGVLMGYADVIARPPPRTGIAADGRKIAIGDVAVLAMRAFAPGGEQAFAEIRGIDLASAVAHAQLEGIFSQPAGIVGGASGSPVLNQDGQAIGVLIGSLTNEQDVDENGKRLWNVDFKLNASDAEWYGNYHAPVGTHREVTLPVKSRSFVEPFTYPAILAALGHAGEVAKSARDIRSIKDVTIPGYPAEACIVYHGDLYPVGRVPKSATVTASLN